MHPMDLSDILKNLVANHFVQHQLHRFRNGLLVHVRSLSLLIVDIPHQTDVIKIAMFFTSARKNPQDSRRPESGVHAHARSTRADARARSRARTQKP